MNGEQMKQVADFGIALAMMVEASAKNERVTLTNGQNKAMIATIKMMASAERPKADS